jgi:hypothetical protein
MSETKTVRIKAETHHSLRVLAAVKGVAMIDLIDELVQAAVEAAKETPNDKRTTSVQ